MPAFSPIIPFAFHVAPVDVSLFLFLTLIGTALWVVQFRLHSFPFLALAMFFPGAAALLIVFLFRRQLFAFVMSAWYVDATVLAYCLLSVALSTVLVLLCGVLSWVMGWGSGNIADGVTILIRHIQTSVAQSRGNGGGAGGGVHEHNKNVLMGFLRAMGEEVGWRSYLLPALLFLFASNSSSSSSSTAPALVITPAHHLLVYHICGVVWGLFHVPVMILLVYYKQLRHARPLAVIIVQFVSCWLNAFVYCMVSERVGVAYSCWPATFMHWSWNRVNPLLLGSIYTNENGEWIKGREQWKLNGEGLSGCIVLGVVAAASHLQLLQ